MSLLKLIPSTVAILAASTVIASARDQLQIAGSSTVLPYSTIVAEAFGENGDFKTPVVEGGGSGAGRKALCEGVGEGTGGVNFHSAVAAQIFHREGATEGR